MADINLKDLLEDITNGWAEHIITKFGNENALSFSYSGTNCPCRSIDWYCPECRYFDYDWECEDSLRWVNMLTRFPLPYQIVVASVKQKIKELLENG